MNDLLKVLDMSEDEQWEWEWLIEHQKIYKYELANYPDNKRMALADLAFRLRDEVDFNIYLEELEVVYHLWQKRGTIDEQMENNLITFTCWLAVYITPIDRIIAALKAKEQK